MSQCCPGDIRQAVRRAPFPPLRRHESGFAGKPIHRLFAHSRMEPLIDDENHGNDQYADDGEAVKDEPVCELHAVRGLPLRNL